MKVAPRRWIVSMMSGLFLTKNWSINLIRITIFLALILAFLIPNFIKMSSAACSLYAFLLAFIIFIVKIILVTMNVIVNHSQSVPIPSTRDELNHSSGTNNKSSNIDIDSEIAPEGIPQELWEKRSLLPKDDPITETFFNDLITQGFDPNDVVNMVQIIARSKIKKDDDDEEDSSKYNNVLILCGHEFVLPFTKVTVDALFTGNFSYLYVIVSFFVNFAMITIGLFVMNETDFWTNLWLSFIYGSALYSTLSPPEVDSYSTKRGDIMTGLTRPINLSVFGLALLGSLWSKEEPEFYKELELPISYKSITSFINILCRLGLLLFPFWSVLFIGHPITAITWLLEWIGQYFFGTSGVSSILDAMLQFARSMLEVALTYYMLDSNYSMLSLSLSCGIIVLLLQIPLVLHIQCNCEKMIWSITTVLLFSLSAFASCYVGAANANICGNEIIFFAIFSIILLDVVIPYISSNSSYLFFVMQINHYYSKTTSSLRMVTPIVFVPLLLGVVLTKTKISPLLTSFFITMYINKAFTEPHIVAFALFLQRFFFIYEMEFLNTPIGMIYGLWISRKAFSTFTIADLYSRARTSMIGKFLDRYIDNDTESTKCLSSSIFLAGMFLPGPDRTFSTVAFTWSLITGAPLISPASLSCLLFPSSPRPNRFWDQTYSVDSYETAKSYIQHLNEHVIETPIYSSFTASLKANLAPLIRLGKLGFTSSNTFYLFLSEPLAALVHIISINANIINFQVRGLEYNNATLCHLGEIAKLKDDINTYKNCSPNIKSKQNYLSSDWSMCAKGINIFQYNISSFEAVNLFIGLDKERAIKYTYISIAYQIAAMPEVLVSEVNSKQGDISKSLEFALSLFDIIYSEEEMSKINYIASQYITSMYDEDMCLEVDKFENMFHGASEKIYELSSRNLLLWLSLLSMDLGPENDTKEEILEFIRINNDRYLVVPAQSTEFNDEFIKGEKDIVSFENIHNTNNVLFFKKSYVLWDVFVVQKEFVRSFWSTEAFTQIFIGEDNPERLSIQEDDRTMRNLIVQACDLPIGYPAFVSPIISSFVPPYQTGILYE